MKNLVHLFKLIWTTVKLMINKILKVMKSKINLLFYSLQIIQPVKK